MTTIEPGGRPVRVLLISQFYPPVIGGVEVHVQALARGLVARGHDVMVATHVTPERPAGESVEDGVRVRALQGLVQRIGPLFTTERRHATPFADPELSAGLRKAAAAFQPDIVHAHNWLGRSYVPVRGASAAPYLVTLHDSGRICAQGRMMFRNEEPCTGPSFQRCMTCCAAQFGPVKGAVTYLGNRAVRRSEASAVDLFLPVSRAVAASNHLAEDGLAFEVVPNFAADTEIQPPREPALSERLPREPYVLQVGDVVADKGVAVLLEARGLMHSPPPFVLIGRIADDVRAALPDGVTALGALPHDEVLLAWRSAALGTIPSLCLDACPTVTFEAMSAGVPVVASAIGGLLDQVVDGETGLLVEPGDPGALAGAIERLMSSAGERERMGLAARARFESEFRADVVIDRIATVYATVAARRHA